MTYASLLVTICLFTSVCVHVSILIADIRKQEEVLGESIQMVPHSRTQFEQSILTLQELLVSQ
jgi:hypothetical protein